MLVDKQDGNGETALYGASVYGLVECMRILLDVGSNINALNDRSWTALHCAAAIWSSRGCSLLIEMGAKSMRSMSMVDPLDAQSKVEMEAFRSQGRSLEVSCSLPQRSMSREKRSSTFSTKLTNLTR